MELLKINNLSKVYTGKVSHTALKNINLTINKGDFVAVMGPSGSGKSTLLNVISTIDKPTSGEVIINSINPHKLKGQELSKFRRNELGFVFQNFNLLDTLTINENIVLPLTLEGVSIDKMNKKVIEVAKNLGIESILNKRTFEISGGQAQRTAVARGIINTPSILLADEPTGNLDSKATDDVMDIFTKLNNEKNVTTLMVTHEPYTASFCKKVIFIKDGEVYKELNKSTNKEEFYEQILSVLFHIGGGR
ncbi:ABC transporter ATP-binding protein [Romboutsia lituseburensis]|uniref:ABC transporter ATP-binding protein n=1 Tax=Romboutsia lituseburensis TaxID=1537 RepID=UPI00215A6B41|nr:ABC transporter ATP-binding protein [Romboutsia lituseburensis]MCR8746275.1 ABC transporter ATP-binding protein [Romboutsia lituseburensis]